MVSKNSFYHLVIEKHDTLNNKDIQINDIVKYLIDNSDIYVYWAIILHDKDVDEFGELKREHYHLHVSLKNQLSKRTIINDFASYLMVNKFAIQCRVVKSVVGSVQYLIHQQYSDKYQYEIKDLMTNDFNETTNIIFDNVSQYDYDIDYLIDLVNSCSSISQIYHELGLKKTRACRCIVNDLWKEKNRYES